MKIIQIKRCIFFRNFFIRIVLLYRRDCYDSLCLLWPKSMIAFTVFGRPVYRYGIFYGITFLLWYHILWWVALRSRMKSYPQVRDVLLHKKDDLFLRCMIWVILGWRLGHVFLYDRWYYSQHLSEILLINQWGMSFIGGVLGVTTVLAVLIRRWKLSFESMKLLGDIVLCIVPIGIFLWRIGNGLNQELWWKPLSQIPARCAQLLTSGWLTRVYPLVDELTRVNTNIIQATTEWLFTGIVSWIILLFIYSKHKAAGLISGVFLIIYGLVRYRVEPLKDLPAKEMLWPLSISQWVMIVFIGVWWWLVRSSSKKFRNR